MAAKLRSRVQLGRDEATAGVQKITGELADLAERAIRDTRRLLVNAHRSADRARAKATTLAQAGVRDAAAGRRRGRLVRAVNDLHALVAATEAIIEQTRVRLSGGTPDGATRVVSLHDAQARPIAKGRLGEPVEFGDKGRVVDDQDGIVLDQDLELGNPTDAPQLVPAVDRITLRTGRVPRAVTADRGYGEAKIDQQLTDRGVRNVVIPRKGNPAPAGPRNTAGVPADRAVADRLRGPDQHPEARIRVGPHTPGFARRSADLVRARHHGSQPGQGRRPDRMKAIEPRSSAPSAIDPSHCARPDPAQSVSFRSN